MAAEEGAAIDLHEERNNRMENNKNAPLEYNLAMYIKTYENILIIHDYHEY